jgi:hypothetical protein
VPTPTAAPPRAPEAAAQLVEIAVACPHRRFCVRIVDQGQQEVLECCVFVVPLIGERQGPVKGLLEAARERGYWASQARITAIQIAK